MKILIELESAGDIWITHAVITRNDGAEEHLESEIAMLGSSKDGVFPVIEAVGRAVSQAIDLPMNFDEKT